jgi:hypothetical protein
MEERVSIGQPHIFDGSLSSLFKFRNPSSEPIDVKLGFWSAEILDKKVSPPFEGGVVGTIDYHIYTAFYFPTGVVDSLISLYLYWYEEQKSIRFFINIKYKSKGKDTNRFIV